MQWIGETETGETNDGGYAIKEATILGMRQFPQKINREDGTIFLDEDGEPVYETVGEHPVTGEPIPAQAIVTQFLPMEEEEE